MHAPWRQIKDALPEDGDAHRFNKIGDALDVSHVQVARYLRRYILPPADGAALELDRVPLDYFDALIDWTPAVPAEVADVLLSAMEASLA